MSTKMFRTALGLLLGLGFAAVGGSSQSVNEVDGVAADETVNAVLVLMADHGRGDVPAVITVSKIDLGGGITAETSFILLSRGGANPRVIEDAVLGLARLETESPTEALLGRTFRVSAEASRANPPPQWAVDAYRSLIRAEPGYIPTVGWHPAVGISVHRGRLGTQGS